MLICSFGLGSRKDIADTAWMCGECQLGLRLEGSLHSLKQVVCFSGKLAPSCWFLSRVKLLRIPGRYGQWPVPAHSLVAAAIPGVETIVASCPQSLAPTSTLAAIKQPVFSPLVLKTAVTSNSTFGIHTCFSTFEVADHSQLISLTALTESHILWACLLRVFLW